MIQPLNIRKLLFKLKKYVNPIRCYSSHVDLTSYKYSPKSVQVELTPVIVLHGLLGTKDNWKSLVRIMSASCNRTMYTLDARNHGDSPHTEEFNYDVMADDVKHFSQRNNLKRIVLLGHSMGGRTAITLALTQPKLIEKLIVVDISPFDMPEDSSVISKYISSMKEVIQLLPKHATISAARQIASDHMAKDVPDMAVRFFLLNNLVYSWKTKNFLWKVNLDVLEQEFTSSIRNYFPPEGVYEGDTLFICGGKSNYVNVADHDRIKKIFPKAEFLYIADAGHWVHSEKPKEFSDAVKHFLS